MEEEEYIQIPPMDCFSIVLAPFPGLVERA